MGSVITSINLANKLIKASVVSFKFQFRNLFQKNNLERDILHDLLCHYIKQYLNRWHQFKQNYRESHQKRAVSDGLKHY